MKKKLSLGFTTFELLLISTIVCILAGIVLSKYSEVSLNNRNEQRKDDIVAMQTAIDTYRAANDKYPSLKQINDSSFRKDNLKTVNEDNLKDPKWARATPGCSSNKNVVLQDSLKPSANCYGYAVSPAGCDNTAVDCTSYTLSANLEPNQSYTKSSSD